MIKNILARNIFWFLLVGLLLSQGVNWQRCCIERGRYLLGIFYNEHFQNNLDGQVYKDYLTTHHITDAFIRQNT